MPLRVLLRDRVAQPSALAGISLAHPFARGLVGAWLPSGTRMVDLLGGLNTTPTTSVTAASNAQIGRVLANTSTTNNGGQAPASSRVEPSAQMTAVLLGRRGAAGTQVGTEVSSNGWGFGYSSGTFPGRVYLRVGAAFADQDCGVASGETAIWGFTYNGATFRAYKNGIQKASQSISGSITHSGAGIVFSGNPASLSNSSANQIGLFLIWNRALSDGEMAAIAANPWQIFEPQPSSRAIAAAVGGAAALQGAAVAVAASAGGLTTAINLSSSAAALAAAAGVLSTSIRLSGSAAAVAAASGGVTSGILLSGGAAAVATSTASLAGAVQLAGAAVAMSSAAGALATGITLSSSASAAAASGGQLTTSIRLVGAAVASATASATFGGGLLLVANSSSASAVATATGSLTTGILLGGAAAAAASSGASLTAAIRLVGALTSISTASGTLTTGAGGSAVLTPARRRLVVVAEQRRQVVQAESRRLVVPPTLRRLIIETENA